MPIGREAFDIVLVVMNDARELIASGKAQRWEVVKWTVTVNVALAAASATLIHSYPNSGWVYSVCAVTTASLGLALVFYYNKRMISARERLKAVHVFIRENVVDLKELLGLEYGTIPKTTFYDKEELTFFSYIIVLSTIPSFVVLALG